MEDDIAPQPVGSGDLSLINLNSALPHELQVRLVIDLGQVGWRHPVNRLSDDLLPGFTQKLLEGHIAAEINPLGVFVEDRCRNRIEDRLQHFVLFPQFPLGPIALFRLLAQVQETEQDCPEEDRQAEGHHSTLDAVPATGELKEEIEGIGEEMFHIESPK